MPRIEFILKLITFHVKATFVKAIITEANFSNASNWQ